MTSTKVDIMSDRHNKPKYKRRDDIFVDIDNTLIVDGELNLDLVEWCRFHK